MGATHFQGVGNELDSLILISKVTLTGVNHTTVFTKEVPAKDKVIDQVLDNATVHAHVAAINAEPHVDNTEGFNLATINTNCFALVRAELISVQVGVATQEVFTYA